MAENFTYQSENTKEALEIYEWDNIWWEYANDKEGKERILIIGDSISCGYRTFVNREYAGAKYADGLGTSKAVDNPHFITVIDYVIAQSENCKKILFNNGLHGWHLNTKEYKENFEKIVLHIKEKYPEKTLIIALTTPLRDKENLKKIAARNDVVIKRNDALGELIKKHKLVSVDLYAELIDHPEYYSKDGVHLTDDGYVVLAKRCVEALENET